MLSNLKSRLEEPIILIGTIEKEPYKDYHPTPYGTEIPGVFLQAQMTSQILSAVLDNRSLIWYWNWRMELIWVWVWSTIGGCLALTIVNPWRLMLNTVGSLFGILGICSVMFTYSGWIPLIPPVISLSIALFIFRKLVFTKN